MASVDDVPSSWNSTTPSAEITVRPLSGVTQKYASSTAEPAGLDTSKVSHKGAQTGWANAAPAASKATQRESINRMNQSLSVGL